MVGRPEPWQAVPLAPVSRPIGCNDVGIVAWTMTLKTPECPTGRRVRGVPQHLRVHAQQALPWTPVQCPALRRSPLEPTSVLPARQGTPPHTDLHPQRTHLHVHSQPWAALLLPAVRARAGGGHCERHHVQLGRLWPRGGRHVPGGCGACAGRAPAPHLPGRQLWRPRGPGLGGQAAPAGGRGQHRPARLGRVLVAPVHARAAQVEWSVPEDPNKGHKYLYLTDADHKALIRGPGGASFRADPLTTAAGAQPGGVPYISFPTAWQRGERAGAG